MLRIQGLTVTFGDRTALDRLDLDVETGSVVALMGPSGAASPRLCAGSIRLVEPIPEPSRGWVGM